MEIYVQEMSMTRKLTYMAMFVAITCVLSRFVSINTTFIKITFSFLPIALAAMLFGPLYGGVVAGVEDLIGATLFPKGAFFPGFTLSAILVGVVYGIVLYKKPKTIKRFTVANLIIAIVINCLLNTWWLVILYDKGFMAIIGMRIVKALVMVPIEVAMLKVTWELIGKRMEKQL